MATDAGLLEQALGKSELRFRTLLSAVSAFTWSCPSSGLQIEPQPEWMAFTGQTSEQMLGLGWAKAVHPEDLVAAASGWRAAVARGEPYAGEHRVRRHDGEWRWMNVRAAPIRDASGEVAEWFGMCIDITEQKQAADALRESEERLRLFVDNSPTVAWMKDADGRYVYRNRAIERRFGGQVADFLGKTDAELWPPDVAAEFRKNDLAVLATGRTIAIVEETREPDQEPSCWLNTKFPFRDKAGKRYVGGIGLDITERKKMEAALRASERRFRAIFNQQFEHSCLVDPEGRILEMSDSVMRGAAAETEVLVGQRFLDAPWWRDTPEMRERWRRQFEEAQAQPGASRGEIEYRAEDGERGYILSAVTALRDERGALEGFLVEGLDITECKLTENALGETEGHLRLALDASRAGSWAWDAKSSTSTWDERFRELYDFPPGSPSRFHEWIERLHPEDRLHILSRIEELRSASGDDQWNEEFRSISSDGRVRWHQNLGRAQRNAAGALDKVVGIDLDVTARKQAEEALREADRRKDEFLATLAHELRNPLAPVRNGLDALRRIGAPTPAADRLLVMMEGQVDHLVRLVNDLMDISRISLGKFELQKQRMDLAAAVAQAVDMSRHLVEAGNLDLRLKLPREPAPVHGDAVRLTQVFSNLLSNAARHTMQEGRIQVSLERAGDVAVVSVADTGVGIPEEFLPYIFEPFVQGGKGGRPDQGLGVGLALVHSITQMHGGTVEAKSGAEGLGSTFVVRLPLLEPARTQAPAPQTASGPLTTSPRLLVIDDMPQVAEALAFLLNVLGANVRVARSGAEGLEACAEFEPELVLLDLSMPHMDGFETARRMRESPVGRRAKLVALTGSGEDHMRARTREAGFDGHLVKPASLSQLEELLASVSRPRTPTPASN
ncbi:PAS domain-containing hybrid sensor histidine kinase/response regulator [Methylocystis bryophila]|nr:PAS domain S-box protein [Methylocystis bryophila]